MTSRGAGFQPSQNGLQRQVWISSDAPESNAEQVSSLLMPSSDA
jgi:hypothetical protein